METTTPCPRRIANYYLKTVLQTVLFLRTTFPTPLGHEGSADTPRASVNHGVLVHRIFRFGIRTVTL